MTAPADSTSEATSRGKPSGSQTLDRGLSLLEVLAAAPRPLTIAQVAEAAGLHRSIVYRLLRTLEEHRLVSRDDSDRFRLGYGLVALTRTLDPDLRAIVGAMGLTGDKAHQYAGTLSGGEKTKLALGILVAGVLAYPFLAVFKPFGFVADGRYSLPLLPQVLTVFAEYEQLVLGLVMMLVMIFLPQGLLPSILREVRGKDE